jgi:hypothetical protein
LGWDDCSSTPEDDEMTLCIAAECEYKGELGVALLADSRAQSWDPTDPASGVAAADVYKLQNIGSATAVLAGNRSRALELASICKPAILRFLQTNPPEMEIDLAIDVLRNEIEQATATRKSELIRRFVLSTYGIEWSEFIKLPTTEYADAWHVVKGLHFEAELIIGCVVHEPIIIFVDRFGRAHWREHYAVIGSGAEVARAMLCLQPWSPRAFHERAAHLMSRVPLEECFFRMREAHHAAHIANPSSVGGSISAQVLFRGYRTTPSSSFAGKCEDLVNQKHVVPEIAAMREKNSVLYFFQNLSTGELSDKEPDEL